MSIVPVNALSGDATIWNTTRILISLASIVPSHDPTKDVSGPDCLVAARIGKQGTMMRLVTTMSTAQKVLRMVPLGG